MTENKEHYLTKLNLTMLLHDESCTICGIGFTEQDIEEGVDFVLSGKEPLSWAHEACWISAHPEEQKLSVEDFEPVRHRLVWINVWGGIIAAGLIAGFLGLTFGPSPAWSIVIALGTVLPLAIICIYLWRYTIGLALAIGYGLYIGGKYRIDELEE